MTDELIYYDAIALGELVRKKEVKPTDLLDITIQRIEKINPRLNAVIPKMYDQGRETAKRWESMMTQGEAMNVRFCGVPNRWDPSLTPGGSSDGRSSEPRLVMGLEYQCGSSCALYGHEAVL